MTKKTLRNFDAYLERFPKNVQWLLHNMRITIKKAAPQAKETISYGIPAFTLNGLLVWFAGAQNPHWLSSFGNRCVQPETESK